VLVVKRKMPESSTRFQNRSSLGQNQTCPLNPAGQERCRRRQRITGENQSVSMDSPSDEKYEF